MEIRTNDDVPEPCNQPCGYTVQYEGGDEGFGSEGICQLEDGGICAPSYPASPVRLLLR